MSMERKFYVSLEVARLLKEKGYNNYSTVYDCSVEGDILLNQEPTYGEWVGDKDVYPCPTKAEAIDWLESKGIVVETFYNRNAKWVFYINKGRLELYDSWCDDDLVFPTRLEAEEAAIIKALELLRKWIRHIAEEKIAH